VNIANVLVLGCCVVPHLRSVLLVLWCREVWNHFTSPGTFHALLKALAGLLTGQGWQYVPPREAQKLRTMRHKKGTEGHRQHGSSHLVNW
jgi:hypothetical protein